MQDNSWLFDVTLVENWLSWISPVSPAVVARTVVSLRKRISRVIHAFSRLIYLQIVTDLVETGIRGRGGVGHQSSWVDGRCWGLRFKMLIWVRQCFICWFQGPEEIMTKPNFWRDSTKMCENIISGTWIWDPMTYDRMNLHLCIDKWRGR